jgi:cytochrome P450
MADGMIGPNGWRDAWSIPLEDINPGAPELFRDDVWAPYFARLRRDAPVHYCHDSAIGPYWSISRFKDIMAVDTNHHDFSSDSRFGGITLRDFDEDFVLPMFIAMDPPRHDDQRKVVQPIVAPGNLANYEPLIRERTRKVLDSLPRNEPFDWVDKVSIELTAMMLATLFDFPQAERRRLSRWSDVATAIPGAGVIDSEEQRRAELFQCLEAFMGLWNDRVNAPPKGDLISMLAHGPATRDMGRMEFLGNLVLLIVGGNDTTRNTMTGSVYALNHLFPDQGAKLRANPALIESMVSEIIRWQTPLAYMRRTALRDVTMHGQTIRQGDKVAMWYVSGNRDETEIADPDQVIIDRERPRHHLSFGFGIHRCVGNRLAELQLKILWQEILARFDRIEIVSAPRFVPSSFVKGYESLMVRLPE